MNALELYDGITGIPEAFIAEAAAYRRKKTGRWRRPLAAAAALVLIAGLGTAAVRRFFGAGAGSGSAGRLGEDGCSYMHYAGPVLPLAVLEDAEEITAERRVDYDFLPYRTVTVTGDGSGGTAYTRFRSETIVTDSYVLTNTGEEDRTLTLLYPAVLRLSDPLRYLPRLTAAGEELEAELHAAPYTGGFGDAWGGNDPAGTVNLAPLSDWQGYAELLADGSYREKAFRPFPVLDMPVVVYKVWNYEVLDPEAQNPTLYFDFRADTERSTVMSYGANRMTWDAETGTGSFGVSSLDRMNVLPMYILVCGEDVPEYSLRGSGQVQAEVERSETTLDAFIRQVWPETDPAAVPAEERSVGSVLPYDVRIGAMEDLLASYGVISQRPAQRYQLGRLEDLSEANSMERVMYLTCRVTVPAGESLRVEAVMHKDASRDYTGKKRNADGYDLASRLGSDLTFTAQYASVSHPEEIRMEENNFGFDPDKGITQVLLDPEVGHYWMQVEKRR
jgi:hypothetical protein